MCVKSCLQDESLGSVSTVVIRGSTEGFLDDVERAVNDAINTYKVGGGI
jgi:T-complex protein 1 subunit theta